jgi:hypothetical protein
LVAPATAALLAVGTARAAFERPPLSSPAAALGGVLAVSPDAVFGNPAAAGEDRGVCAWAGGGRPFGIAGLSDGQAAFVLTGACAVGAGVRRFGSPAYRELEVRTVGAWRAAPGLAAGVALRGLEVSGHGLAPRRTVALDVALRARPEPGTEIGAVVEAVLGAVPGDAAHHRPRTALGLSRRVARGLRLHLEAQRREDRPVGAVIGAAWSPSAALVLRAGIRERPFTPAWGFTVRARGLALDGSVTHSDPLGQTLRVGVGRRPPDGG